MDARSEHGPWPHRLRPAFNLAVAGAVLLVGIALFALWLWGRAPAPPDYGGRPVLRVLLIGNSLTAANDLPSLVMKMSIAAEEGAVIEATGRAVPGASLDDHLLAGADTLIQQSKWDFVILQQGPSSLPESREQLLAAARTYDALVRSSGATPAFYMVWPEEARSQAFDRVCESYRLAALEINALLLPVGEAWQIAWAKDDSLPLYSADRFHPSDTGTYLAALVICSGLTGTSALELPGPEELGLSARLTPRQVQMLQEAAAESLQKAAAASPEPGTAVR
jgi:hypothetical protein